MKSKISKLVKVEYLLLGLIAALLTFSLFCDYQEQKKMKIAKTRDQLVFSHLVAFENALIQMDSSELRQFLRYFQAMVKSDPSQADAYSLMGFCYYSLDEKDNARAAYEQAASLNSGFFWFHYNLALIDFKKENYPQALKEFQKALDVKPTDNITFLRNFKNFVYIIYKADPIAPPLEERLQKGYGLAIYFSAICLEKMGEQKQSALMRQSIQSLGLQEKDLQPRLRLF